MASEETYLAVLKASFDYDPQEDAEDELPIKENQLLFLIERVDESLAIHSPCSPILCPDHHFTPRWWKVRVKTDSPDEQGASGLVPAAYVEEVSNLAATLLGRLYSTNHNDRQNV